MKIKKEDEDKKKQKLWEELISMIPCDILTKKSPSPFSI